MRRAWRYLRGHLLLAAPQDLLAEVERSHPLRCLEPCPVPREADVARGTGRGRRWEAVRLPPPAPPPGALWVRRAVAEGAEEAELVAHLARSGRAVYGSLDLEVLGQLEVSHGSPTPDAAIRLPGADQAAFRAQPALAELGLWEADRAPWRPRGEGVTVVILDSGPEAGRAGPPFDPELVDVYVEWPQRLPEGLPVLAEIPEPDGSECGVVDRRRPVVWSPLLATDEQMRAYRAHHGVMVASLVRLVAPRAQIVLVRVLNGALGAATYEVVEAMRWVGALARSPVPHPDTGRPLVSAPLVYNLSLGVDRSQPETVQSCVLLLAVDELARQRALMVCAAGNLSQGRPENCLEPAAYGQFGDTLAAQTQVVPVAATSAAQPDRYAWFSNEAHFGAPGEDLVLDCGTEVAGSRYLRWSGTSFAAALVSGVLAVWLSTGLPPESAKARLWERARRPSRWDGVHAVRL